MSNKYGLFWNSNNGDRTYDADSFAEWLTPFFKNGVFVSSFPISADGGMTVTIGKGTTYINGKVRTFDDSTTLTIGTASGSYPRIDNIVIERNDTDRQISLKVVQGTYSGSTATATAPTRSGGVYQLVVARVQVPAGATKITAGNLIDCRADTTLCGYVSNAIDSPDFDSWFTLCQTKFDKWFSNLKTQLSTDVAGNLQNQIDGTMDRVFPVGSIYMSINSTSPATLFGGTWEQLKSGFLLSAGFQYEKWVYACAENETFTVGYNDAATVLARFGTGDKFVYKWLASGSYTANSATFGSDPDVGKKKHVDIFKTITVESGQTGGESNVVLNTAEMPVHRHDQYVSANVVSGPAERLDWNADAGAGGAAAFWQGIQTGSAGGGYSHSNMPPYVGVYMWSRTA